MKGESKKGGPPFRRVVHKRVDHRRVDDGWTTLPKGGSYKDGSSKGGWWVGHPSEGWFIEGWTTLNKYTQLVECLWGVNKKIPNRIRGKSCNLLQPNLAQQWFKSVHGDYGPKLFQLILPILKEITYEEAKDQIKLLKYF